MKKLFTLPKYSMKANTSLMRICKIVVLASLLCLIASRAFSQEPLKEYSFEDDPEYLPDWGLAYHNDYKPATGWTTPAKVTLDSADPHSGRASLKENFVQKSDGPVKLYTKNIPIPEGASSVSITFYVRTKNMAKAKISVGILEQDETKPLGFVGDTEKLKAVPSPEKWEKVTVSGQLRPETRGIIFMLDVGALDAPGQLWLDDIVVEAGK